MLLPDERMTLYIVIVLYKMKPTASETFQTLLRSLDAVAEEDLSYRILLYDNTPPPQPPTGLPNRVEYIASAANTGLADAYNLAISRAHEGGFEWLLTLDQDTDLPLDFIRKLIDVAKICGARKEIAAIVPHIRAGSRDVSPNWFAGGVWPRWFQRDYMGVPKQAVYAFNSGTSVRISSVESIGGYSPFFWLDYCDGYLYRQIERRGLKVYIAGHIHLQHDFSLLDVSNKMSLFRYRNSLEAGSAFYDIEMSWLAGYDHTLRLLMRYFKQTLRRESQEVRRATITVFLRRVFMSRKRRIQEWTDAQVQRITATVVRPPQ
ncbi:MAG: glycosyltransferase [Terriglobus sp.]